jgi:CRISPR/Cas system Type II protein with McrA/HNH and RuvC-like nuclease domain
MDEKISSELIGKYPDLFDYWWNQGYQIGKRTGWKEGREHAREDIKKKLKDNGLISMKESEGKIKSWKDIADERLKELKKLRGIKNHVYAGKWQQKKQQLLKIQNFKCIYCFCELDIFTSTIDHVIAKSKGGKNLKQNLVIACAECNQKKSDREPEIIPLSS